jgi:hypothetical protein
MFMGTVHLIFSSVYKFQNIPTIISLKYHYTSKKKKTQFMYNLYMYIYVYITQIIN